MTNTTIPAAFTENSPFAQACIDAADPTRASDVQARLQAEGEAITRTPVRNFASYEDAVAWTQDRLAEGNFDHALLAELRECSFLRLTADEAEALLAQAKEAQA